MNETPRSTNPPARVRVQPRPQTHRGRSSPRLTWSWVNANGGLNMKSLVRKFRRLEEAVRWRRPLIVSLMIIRKIFRPFITWDVLDVFETDLRLPLPESYTKETLDVRAYAGNQDLNCAVEDLTSFNELLPADIELRFARGDVVAVAYAEAEVVGCAWLTFSSRIEHAFGTSWLIHPTEALRYDSFVRPDWRGRAVHSLLNNAMNRYARDHGILRTLGEISVLNTQSLSLPRHFRKARTMRLILIQVRAVKWTYRKAIGAPFESRFAIEPGLPNRSPRPSSLPGFVLGKS